MVKTIIVTTSTNLGGFIGWYLGGFDGFLYALIAFVIADYITGVLAAINQQELSSAVGFRGIARKVLIFVLVASQPRLLSFLTMLGYVLSGPIYTFLFLPRRHPGLLKDTPNS